MGAITSLPAFYCKREDATLTRYREERQRCVEFMSRTLSEVEQRAAKGGDGDLSATEQESLQRQKDRITELDKQIKPLAEFEELAQVSNQTVRTFSAQAPAGDEGEQRGAESLGVTAKDRAYEYPTRGHVIVDLIRQRTGQYKSKSGSVTITDAEQRAARDRLMRAGVVFPEAPAEYLKRIQNETTANIQGVLPKPIVGPILTDLDGARPFINSIGAKDLSGIPGESFSRPVVTQKTASGKQATQKTELPSQQLVITGVPFTKETYGGALDVARQVIDWSSPEAWNAILADLQDVYGVNTEDVSAAAFVAAITQTVDAPATDDLKGWATAVYAAAAAAYGGARRLPNHMWVSLDMWAKMGAVVDVARRSFRKSDSDGTSSPASFEGQVLDLPRTVVPSFPDGTVIIGTTSLTEFYEERIGLLSAVEPRLLGVEIAYGGYVAYGTLKPLGFAKVTAPVTP